MLGKTLLRQEHFHTAKTTVGGGPGTGGTGSISKLNLYGRYFNMCSLLPDPLDWYSVLGTLYSVLCAPYSVHCTLYSGLCTRYSVPCTLYNVLKWVGGAAGRQGPERCRAALAGRPRPAGGGRGLRRAPAPRWGVAQLGRQLAHGAGRHTLQWSLVSRETLNHVVSLLTLDLLDL